MSLRGLYAITDTPLLAGGKLLPYAEAALIGGARLLQYRAYREVADIIIETDERPPRMVVQEILSRLEALSPR